MHPHPHESLAEMEIGDGEEVPRAGSSKRCCGGFLKLFLAKVGQGKAATSLRKVGVNLKKGVAMFPMTRRQTSP